MHLVHLKKAFRLAAMAAVFGVSAFSIARAASGAGGNALDRIDFGTGASETDHQFNEGKNDGPLAGTGALGQTYRAPNPVAGENPNREQ